jgi:hypothetical protein
LSTTQSFQHNTSGDLHNLAYVLQRWLETVCSTITIPPLEDDKLQDIIFTKLKTVPAVVVDEAHRIIGAPLTLHSLLYRHYLCRYVVSEDIFTQINWPPLYGLIASMLTDQVVFTPLYTSTLWDGIDHNPFPINGLRQQRPFVARYAHDLTMREDVTEHQLIRDHGLLSALSLVYGLYLVRVILIHEMTTAPSQALKVILESLANTLADLKGVFHNVESRWFIPHVR